MGLNYSYRLFFPRDRLWPVLRALAGFACAPPAEEWIVLERADASRLRLPFTSSYDASGAHRSWERRSEPIQLNATVRKLQFNASLFFAADAAIAPYVQSLRDDWCDTVPSEAGDEPDSLPIRDAQGRYAIGWIDLIVLLHPGGEGGIPAGADRIAFEFVAVTTAMSLLFAQSTAIRSTFVRLLEEHAGLCGLFDDEFLPGQAQPFWPPGRAG